LPSRKQTGTSAGQQALGIDGDKPRVPEWDPRCYDGGNGPNPYLAEWIAEHAKPYDPATDDYRREALAEALKASKTAAIYNMHTYRSKKPYDAIVQYIEHYTQPGDIVLDPFCGSGSTALSALTLGRHAVAIDLSPAATFITKNYCCPIDRNVILAAFEDLRDRVGPAVQSLYRTSCDRCGGSATIAYTIHSHQFRCRRCTAIVPLFGCVPIEVPAAGRARATRTINACPHCYSRGSVEAISSRGPKFGLVPVVSGCLCQSGCTPPYFEQCQAGTEIDPTSAAGSTAAVLAAGAWHPDALLADVIPYRMLVKKDFRPEDATHFRDLYTPRNRSAVGQLLDAIRRSEPTARDGLLFALSGILGGVSRMCQCQAGYVEADSMTMLVITGTYYLPQSSKELNVWMMYENQVKKVLKGWQAYRARLAGDCVISTQTATGMASLPSRSVDYVFTDPPYGGTVQYGELNYLWEAWLGFDTGWRTDEIVVNEARNQDLSRWAGLLLASMQECHRVLKPGRWLSLCYHDTSEGTWDLVQEVMAEAGFVPDESEHAQAIDVGQRSYNRVTADKVLKRDLVINFRKPYPGERPVRVRVAFAPGDTPELFEQKVISIAQAFLTKYPGSPRDVIWDAVVSRLVRQGDMERHDFDAILTQVAAPNEAGEWYLTVDEADEIGDSEAAKADAAAAALEKAIARHQEGTGSEGMHYSDILEWYVVQYRGDRPSRQLTDWLPDYFFQAPAGGYRNPASDAEREQKRMGRDTGLNRLIRRYLRAPASVEPAPDQASLCDWLRHCYRSGLYEEGCRLVDEGHIRLADLPAETQGDVEDDAAMCRSRLRQRAEIARVEKPAKKTRARKPKPEQQDLGI